MFDLKNDFFLYNERQKQIKIKRESFTCQNFQWLENFLVLHLKNLRLTSKKKDK